MNEWLVLICWTSIQLNKNPTERESNWTRSDWMRILIGLIPANTSASLLIISSFSQRHFAFSRAHSTFRSCTSGTIIKNEAIVAFLLDTPITQDASRIVSSLASISWDRFQNHSFLSARLVYLYWEKKKKKWLLLAASPSSSRLLSSTMSRVDPLLRRNWRLKRSKTLWGSTSDPSRKIFSLEPPFRITC